MSRDSELEQANQTIKEAKEAAREEELSRPFEGDREVEPAEPAREQDEEG